MSNFRRGSVLEADRTFDTSVWRREARHDSDRHRALDPLFRCGDGDLWNPLIDSLRTLQEAASLGNVAKALGVKRFSLGSFSEAPRLFEPEKLKPVVEELAAHARPLLKDPRLKDLER